MREQLSKFVDYQPRHASARLTRLSGFVVLSAGLIEAAVYGTHLISDAARDIGAGADLISTAKAIGVGVVGAMAIRPGPQLVDRLADHLSAHQADRH
jgi:hypothetical protein